jgi:phage shock protein C
MQQSSTNVILRHDTFFGICEAIGQDFGFNPNWLRIVFALTVLWSIENALIAYVALGVAVLASRLVFPKKSVSPPTEELSVPEEMRLAA